MAGANPYGPAFARYAGSYIPPGGQVWAYPPQWWLITTGLALFPDAVAFTFWHALNVLALLGGGVLIYRAVVEAGERPPLWASLMFAAVLLLLDLAKSASMLGQSSCLLVFDFGLVLLGIVRRSDGFASAGIAMLLLKPHFGLIFLVAFFARPETRRAALLAVIASAVAALPIIFEFGVDGAVEGARGLLFNIRHYAGMKWNRPPELTGIPYLLWALGLPVLSSLACMALGAAISAALLLRTRDAIALALLPLVACYIAVPLHPYDLTVLPAVLLFVRRFSMLAQVWISAMVGVSARMSGVAFAMFAGPGLPYDNVWPLSVASAGFLVLTSWAVAIPVTLALVDLQAPEAGSAPVAAADDQVTGAS